MKKTTLVFLLLVVISTMLIAGCTEQKSAVTSTPAPAVTAVPTYVQNQQGVAIFRTVNVTATPTAAVPGYEVVAVGVKSNDTVKVAVKTNESVVVGVKTNQTVAVKP
jgi:PBP1b-binding outer membrane lipoprotein LpoB